MSDRVLYEILFRFDENGKLKGAHAQYLKDGFPGPAIPLSLVESKDKPTVKGALGNAMASCLESKEAAEAKAVELQADFKAKIAELQADVETKAARVVALEAKLADFSSTNIEHLRADNAAKDANIQTLLAENEALRAGAQG